jgi:hypothetical protein
LILAAHQPAYLPWLGYFDKMARADLFVVIDDVQYEPQGFQNRNRVKVNNGLAWLTVPVDRALRGAPIREQRVAEERAGRNHWQRRAWSTLAVHYGPSPWFKSYAAELADVFSRRWERLLDLDLHVMRLCMRWLGIARPLLLSSQLGARGSKTHRIVELCRRAGADRYLSGDGGSRLYLDVALLAEAGIAVDWQNFNHPIYRQRYPALGFVPRLSAIDLILNCGPASGALLASAGAVPSVGALCAGGFEW